MSKSKNLVILIGNVGQDPKVRETASGKAMATFGLATSRNFKKGDEWEEETTWHNIVCFGHQADTVEKFVTKGKKLYVEGMIKHRKWTDKEGNQRDSTSIFAFDIILMAKSKDQRDSGASTISDDDNPPF